MKAAIPWLRVFIEGVVIVGSILLAFGIDAWWEGRQEREEEAQLLMSLHEEFSSARSVMKAEGVDRHNAASETATRLAEFGRTGDGTLVPDVRAAFSSGFLRTPSTHLETGTLDVTLTSGRLELISNAELRSLLGAWPATYAEFTEQEQVIWTWVTEIAAPVVDGAIPRVQEAPPMPELT